MQCLGNYSIFSIHNLLQFFSRRSFIIFLIFIILKNKDFSMLLEILDIVVYVIPNYIKYYSY